MPVDQEPDLTERDFQLVSDLVYRHCGINLKDGKRQLVASRLAKRIRLAGFPNAAQYLAFVQEDSSGREFATLIDAISTNLTSFFRENDHFEYLRGELLPSLLERKRACSDFKIRVWSAGCSSGEEPYSLAMTLLGAIAGEGRWDIKILATDISGRVLEKARRGVYDSSRIESLPPALSRQYFIPIQSEQGPAARVVETVKQVIRFRYLNLMEPWPFQGPFDFIFCRNVMIYFDKPTQEKLVNRFWECLQPGGMMFTGHSESLTGVSHRFDYVQPTIYVK